MARSKKQTVDYFPHYAKAGKTLFILESKWKNDGYTFFFKFLETLCETDGHFIDFNNVEAREYFLAKVNLEEATVIEMFNKLANLNKIDAELWGEGVIWYQNLVDNLKDVYANRKCSLPEKPSKNEITTSRNPVTLPFLLVETPPSSISTGRNPQSKVKESKGKESTISGEQISPAKKEIEITHPLQIFVRDNFERVAKMPKQLTAEQCDELLSEYSKQEIKETLESMENWGALLTGKTGSKPNQSVFLTIKNWTNRERKRNADSKSAATNNGKSDYEKRRNFDISAVKRSHEARERDGFVSTIPSIIGLS